MRFGKRTSDADAASLLDAVQEAGEENMSRFTKDVLAALYVLWQERGDELPLTREGILEFLRAYGTAQPVLASPSYQPPETASTQSTGTNRSTILTSLN